MGLTAAASCPERIGWVVNLDGLGPPAGAFAEGRSRRGGAINVRLPRRFLDHLVAHGTTETEGGYRWKTDPLFSLGVPDGFSLEMIDVEWWSAIAV